MNTLNKPWKDWTRDELANEADTGTRGQGAVVEATWRLVEATRNAGDCASVQTAEVIKLTNTLRVLTWVLIVLGVVQVGLFVWKG